ncbi:hypothetical protein [Nocardia goodfellowii]|uniref:Enamine deaminase RidA (YjgF/YER057c/UK114 family) n=1 Tax=Nocardia goodfellowii TaxID=882446 RepID=A0ABS4QSI1_9NOCA|nr:hypothetical protein [Nocardia goodfellowii]MBP2194503.1 enamine deaminase RidA (YjgF/YER057c/UK114 family) [Nocardia goodfellowii]
MGHDLAKFEVLGKKIAGIGASALAQTLIGVVAMPLRDMLFEVDAIAAVG